MAILLGAFLIHGLVPGPDMLHKNLDITYSMVWSVALANILGAGMCYAFSPQFARLATLRFSLICPAVMGIIYIGAFEATRQWGDLYALLFFGLVGWFMKQFKWPRPPLILGAVLGDTIERYMFISVERYGISWFARPVVAILFIVAIVGLVRPLLQDIKIHGGVKKMATNFQAPTFRANQLFTIFMICVVGSMVFIATQWDFSAKIVPLVVGTVALTALGFSLLNDMCRRPETAADGDIAEQTMHDIERRIGVAEGTGSGKVDEKLHMDLASDTAHLPIPVIAKRAARFFGYLIAFMGVMAVIGLVPTAALFVVVFMRYENREPWHLIIAYAIVLVFAVSFVFDNVMSIPWPPTLLAQWFPALKFLPSI
jgi:hypothetical protein